jgi:hypothetical protein
MESIRATPGKRSSDRTVIRNKSYNKFRSGGHLTYNEFKKIDFVDSEGRQYVFNSVKNGPAEPREFDDPPRFITNKMSFNEDTPITTKRFGKISMSVRVPSRSNDVDKKLELPSTIERNIYLFSEETGVICKGRMQVSPSMRFGAKTAKAVVKNFEIVGRVDDLSEFQKFVRS